MGNLNGKLGSIVWEISMGKFDGEIIWVISIGICYGEFSQT